MKRLLPLILVMAMLFCACAKPAENPTPSTTENVPTSGPTGTTNNPETKPQGTVSGTTPADPTNPSDPTGTTPPVLNYTNPLTGEPLAEPSTQRPVAVMLNNIKAAMPQHGVSQADILYEVLAEGGITRCLGIYTDLSDVEKIGSIRSARKYYIELAQGYGAAYVHAGGSKEADNYLAGLKGMDLDAGKSSTHFYRDQNRLNSGYALEHTLFSSGEKILAYAALRNVNTQLSGEKTYGMSFSDDKILAGKSAQKVTVYFNMGGKPGSHTKSTAFTYDAQTKLYSAAQYGGDYIDGNTKHTVAFRNLVVLYAATNLQSDQYHLTVKTTGNGTGYFVCNGQMVSIQWSRKTVNDPFTFTLENGSPVTFGVGSTYIGIVPAGATVSAQ